MLLIYLLTGWGFLWLLRQLWPLHYLNFVSGEEAAAEGLLCPETTWLDVRDASEAQDHPIPGAINISIGRLPYTWDKYLSANERVLIFANHSFGAKRAARMLRKRGFQHLSAVRGTAKSYTFNQNVQCSRTGQPGEQPASLKCCCTC
ncbi:rhodanese-like domain-containing protein [Paenibacillus sp. JX-17]|uniref:Rhodanese-like domain-containing protein n=1 Tax=Paenibacillus lacisoli TaxID=3064525 RepID=A0ABT9CFC5_9BACL|nr:rhodanese-like domain-containing protein [Paenibacillus sp. JX-17]MDO7907957.1 rhodanese-like domain-containing protein [Paenibacillus sp. JX-17]